MLVIEVEKALLQYTDYAKAIHGGKLVKDQHFHLHDMPEDCRLLRPDLVVQNQAARKLHIFEFACPFARVAKNGDSLQLAYDHKQKKYEKLYNLAKERFIGWDVQLVTVIVSSLGAVFQTSLKRLTSVLELSPTQTVRIGQRLSDAAICGSLAIWRKYQHEVASLPSDVEANGSTSEVESSSDDSDIVQTSSDAGNDNNNNTNVVTDCTQEEYDFANAVVRRVANEDNVTPIQEERGDYEKLLDEEPDRLSPSDEEDDADDENMNPDPEQISYRENHSPIESPSSDWEEHSPMNKRIPCPERQNLEKRIEAHEEERIADEKRH
jgi:hypothetical protein